MNLFLAIVTVTVGDKNADEIKYEAQQDKETIASMYGTFTLV